ncbi:MAG: 4Fe-4S binding protein [Planctomycetes bacterium]|nr:4Fe-4S binding protein [Planctomycetota bacterium]
MTSGTRSKERGAPRVRMGRRRAWVLAGVHLVIFLHLLHWQLAGRSLSPLEPSETMYALGDGLINAGAILMALSTLSVLVVGRFFCGWACHLVALQDLCSWLLGRLGISPLPLRSRFLWLVPFGAALVMFGMPVYARASRGLGMPEPSNALIKEDFWATFPGFWLALATFLVCGFLMVWFLGSKGFCSYACPYGGVFALADRLAPGRIRVDENCKTCGLCTAACGSNVAVAEEVHRFGMVVDSGCMKCLDCVVACPEEALRFGFGAPALARRSGDARRRRRDFGLGLDLIMGLVFVLALATFAGLPESFAPWGSSFMGRTPLLLALAIAILAAFGLGVGWRSLRGGPFAITGLRLRGERGPTRAGLVVVMVVALGLSGCGLAGLIQYHWFRGKAANLAIDDLLRRPMTDREARARDLRVLEDRAIRHFEIARAISPLSDPRLAAELGELAKGRRDLARAAREFAAATAAEPDQGIWRLKYGLILAELGRHDEAAAEGRAACALLPGDLQAHQLARQWAIRAEAWRLAAEVTEAMKALLPRERLPDLELDLVEFDLRAGDRDRALARLAALEAAGFDSPRLQHYRRQLGSR